MKRLATTLLLLLSLGTGICTADTTTATPAAPAPAAPPAPPAAPAPEPTQPAIAPAKGPSLLAGPLNLAPPASPARVKIGYLDFARLSQASKTALKAKQTVTTAGDKLKKKLNNQGKKLEALKKSLEAKGAQMNELEREAKQREFLGKVKEYQEAVQNAEKEMAKLEESTTKKLVEQVTKVVKEYGEKNGFAMIVANREVLYFDGNQQLVDVTDNIVTALDR